MSVLNSYLGGTMQRQSDDMLSRYRQGNESGGSEFMTGTDAMTALQDAFSAVESSGRYDAIGPETGKGRAYGKYQVMDFNIPDWTETILGTRMTPDQFLATPGAQDAVFNAKMQEYMKRYGTVEDAASMWFSGKPYAGNNRSDGYLTVPEYVSRVTANYNPLEASLP